MAVQSTAARPEWKPDARARYLLLILGLIYFFSVLDRSVIAILAQPIKADLGLSDAELGIVSGIAFALTYSLVSLPAARLSERHGRIGIISGALAIWSAATMLCGAVGSFAHLVLARAGVGMGEAVCHPCAQSLIADSYPPHRRASAVAIYSLAVPIATMAGLVGGAFLAREFGWRGAFALVGAAGIPLALLARLTVREPARGQFDGDVGADVPSYGAIVRHLRARRTFLHLAIGFTSTTIAATGMAAFMASFLLRGGFGLKIEQVGLLYGAIGGGGMFVGMLAGGLLADRLGRRDPRHYMLVPAASLVIVAIALILAFLQTGLAGFVLFAAIGHVGLLLYTGPTWATLHSLTEPRMRATAAAMLALINGVIGSGMGPVLAGWFSDFAASRAYAGDFAETCRGAALLDGACRTASFVGVRDALVAISAFHLYAAFHYWRASNWIEHDLLVKDRSAEPTERRGEQNHHRQIWVNETTH